MIPALIPSEWVIKCYIKRNKQDQVVVSKKTPKKVIEYFQELDDAYFELYETHFLYFDNHEVFKKLKIPKDFPEYTHIP